MAVAVAADPPLVAPWVVAPATPRAPLLPSPPLPPPRTLFTATGFLCLARTSGPAAPVRAALLPVAAGAAVVPGAAGEAREERSIRKLLPLPLPMLLQTDRCHHRRRLVTRVRLPPVAAAAPRSTTAARRCRVERGSLRRDRDRRPRCSRAGRTTRRSLLPPRAWGRMPPPLQRAATAVILVLMLVPVRGLVRGGRRRSRRNARPPRRASKSSTSPSKTSTPPAPRTPAPAEGAALTAAAAAARREAGSRTAAAPVAEAAPATATSGSPRLSRTGEVGRTAR